MEVSFPSRKHAQTNRFEAAEYSILASNSPLDPHTLHPLSAVRAIRSGRHSLRLAETLRIQCKHRRRPSAAIRRHQPAAAATEYWRRYESNGHTLVGGKPIAAAAAAKLCFSRVDDEESGLPALSAGCRRCGPGAFIASREPVECLPFEISCSRPSALSRRDGHDESFVEISDRDPILSVARAVVSGPRTSAGRTGGRAA